MRADQPARAAGQAQDRTTVSFAINEDSKEKAFDVMFALGARARSRALIVQQCACTAPVVGHRPCAPAAPGTIAFAFGNTVLPEVQATVGGDVKKTMCAPRCPPAAPSCAPAHCLRGCWAALCAAP